MKFGRIFRMIAEGREQTHTINFPLTCRFRVNNAALPYAAESTFQIYNLAPEVRRDLNKDTFQQAIYKRLSFAAGYETEGNRAGDKGMDHRNKRAIGRLCPTE